MTCNVLMGTVVKPYSLTHSLYVDLLIVIVNDFTRKRTSGMMCLDVLCVLLTVWLTWLSVAVINV